MHITETEGPCLYKFNILRGRVKNRQKMFPRTGLQRKLFSKKKVIRLLEHRSKKYFHNFKVGPRVIVTLGCPTHYLFKPCLTQLQNLPTKEEYSF